MGQKSNNKKAKQTQIGKLFFCSLLATCVGMPLAFSCLVVWKIAEGGVGEGGKKVFLYPLLGEEKSYPNITLVTPLMVIMARDALVGSLHP